MGRKRLLRVMAEINDVQKWQASEKRKKKRRRKEEKKEEDDKKEEEEEEKKKKEVEDDDEAKKKKKEERGGRRRTRRREKTLKGCLGCPALKLLPCKTVGWQADRTISTDFTNSHVSHVAEKYRNEENKMGRQKEM